jgi:hypothetical protein
MSERPLSSDPITRLGGGGSSAYGVGRPQARDSLVDLLDRVLDKGVVMRATSRSAYSTSSY